MNYQSNSKLNSSNGKRTCRRRGISLVIVVLLVSLAMAVSFAVIHTQGTALAVQQNSDLRASARQAALAGMAVALREAHSPGWIGAGASFAKDLSASERFTVTYSTGDATLAEGDADYAEYPYRLTIRVNGQAFDPNSSDRKANHCIEAVVRLVPQSVEDEPSGWSEIQDNTFCQWDRDEVALTIPCRIEGKTRIRGPLKLCYYDMDWSSSVRSYYLRHLDFMWDKGLPDYRPFNGTMTIARSQQDSITLDMLENDLDLHLHDASSDRIYSWSMPLYAGSYCLYPGGKTYYSEIVSGDIRDTQLKPDPKTNPLGVFISSSEIRFAGNVSLEGTLVCNGDVKVVSGTNTFTSPKFPPYTHRDIPSNAIIQLPAIVSNDDFEAQVGTSTTVNGLVLVKDKFLVKEDTQSGIAVTVSGKIAAKRLDIRPRSEWRNSRDWWNLVWSLYYPYRLYYPMWGDSFPTWLSDASDSTIAPVPHICIKPNPEANCYHWYNGNNPLFKPPSADEGLTWELIRWTDNP